MGQVTPRATGSHRTAIVHLDQRLGSLGLPAMPTGLLGAEPGPRRAADRALPVR